MRVRIDASFIESITITGFKSIAKQTLPLGRLNVVIGANGSGKTNLLEAAGVLGAAVNGRVDDARLLWRGVRPGVPSRYLTSLEDVRPPKAIKLTARSRGGVVYSVSLDRMPRAHDTSPWRFVSETLSEGDRRILTRTTRKVRVLTDETDWTSGYSPIDGSLGKALAFNPLSPSGATMLSRLMTFAVFDPQTPMLRGHVGDAFQLDPLGLGGGGLPDALASILRPDGGIGPLPRAELFELLGWASAVEVGPPEPAFMSPSVPASTKVIRFVDQRMRSGANIVSASDASEGALYVLFMLALLLHPRTPGFFAIEHFDHALHPRLARALVAKIGDHIRASGRQIVLTTHNPLVLDGLALADDDIRLFTVDRTESGQTVIRRVEYTDALAKATASNAPLSQIWTSGLLGAVPNIW